MWSNPRCSLQSTLAKEDSVPGLDAGQAYRQGRIQGHHQRPESRAITWKLTKASGSFLERTLFAHIPEKLKLLKASMYDG